MGWMDRTILAFREISRWKFSRPIFIGDTIHVVLRVTESKPVPRLRGGVVKINVQVKNHEGETVQHGEWNVIMQSQTQD